MQKIVCIGNPVYDQILTPTSQSLDRILSGCSTNASIALSKLGLHSHIIGCVGGDRESLLRSDLKERGVEFDLLPSEQTGGFKLEYYDDRGNRDLSIIGIADKIRFERFPVLTEASIIILGPILGEISEGFVSELKIYTDSPIFFDPQGTLRRVADGRIVHEITIDFIELARASKIIKANEVETQTVTGIDPRNNPQKAVEELHRYGAEISIVTLSDAGSIIFDGNSIYEIPPYSTNAIDPTGAGDTYAAGFCYQFLRDPFDLILAGCFGSAVASVMVENRGPDFPLTLVEAERRAKALLNGHLGLRL